MNINKTLVSKCVGAAMVLATVAIGGCQLYFGDPSGSDTGGGGGGGGSGSGYSCASNTDCAAGCYCNNGVCEEGGFCGSDSDCGQGYHCDATRASCEPNPPAPVCDANNPCPQGQYCDATGTCQTSCICDNDADAVRQGFGWCDTTSHTCEPGTDPAGDCNDPVTCTTKAPTCAAGSVPLVLAGCYTGDCRSIDLCEGPPACSDLQNESDCLSRAADCTATYVGHNCHSSDGSSCTSGSTGCTCDTFTFASCDDKPTNGLVQATDAAGVIHNVSTLQ